jgi:23S rRNA (cytidine1920-2'-O)/16S rRNA (cytidine1409-2'-O)-methyltransferase
MKARDKSLQRAVRQEEGRTRTRDRKQRLDLLLTERGLVESRQKAQALILAGKIRVNGTRMDKAGALVSSSAAVELADHGHLYASRAGAKLAGALADFGLDPEGRVCLDVGSSTGGFTDCLLQRGAARVFAVDVTTSQLAWKLQQDPRVTAVERNARYLRADDLAAVPTLVTVDLSFISVTKVLPRLVALAAPGAEYLILVKPQFELERGQVGRGGIVREPAMRERAVERVSAAARLAGLDVLGARPSQVPGAEGNQEIFIHARGPVAAITATEPKSME